MIVDAHVHVFPPEVTADPGRYRRLDRTFGTLYSTGKERLAKADDLVASMDRHGIDVSVLANIGWESQELCRESNDYLLDAARRHPGRLIPFCGVNPALGKEAADEVERCARLGARGVGELHPDTQGFDLASEEVMAPVMRAAANNGMIVLTHASEPVGHAYAGKGTVAPHVLYAFIQAFPAVRIICAHWGGGLPFYALMPEVKAAMENVWFDTAASPFLYRPEVFRAVAGLVGPERILFATDFPLIAPVRLLGQVAKSGLDADAQAMVLGNNAVKLFGLTGQS